MLYKHSKATFLKYDLTLSSRKRLIICPVIGRIQRNITSKEE